MEALANRACKEPAVAHYICLLAKTLEKGPWPSQAFIRGMIQADGQSLPITHLHQGEAAGASGQSPRGSSDSPRLTETKKEKEEQA